MHTKNDDWHQMSWVKRGFEINPIQTFSAQKIKELNFIDVVCKTTVTWPNATYSSKN